MFFPLSDHNVNTKRTFESIVVRPIKQSQLEELGRWLQKQDWNTVIEQITNTDNKLSKFYELVHNKINEVCPLKTFKVSIEDPPWMNIRIKTEMRKRDREFQKHRKSPKWKSLNLKCRQMCENAKASYYTDFIEGLYQTEPRTWMQRMKRLGKGPDENNKDSFQITNQIGKTDQEQAEAIAEFFANISANFEPINRQYFDILPPSAPFCSSVPCFPQEYEIYQILSLSKKTSSVPGDIPMKILTEFLPELTDPITRIFTSAIQEGVYPSDFKVEYISPIPKCYPPESFEDLRPLSLTQFFSKKFEELILKGTPSVKGLLHYIKKYMIQTNLLSRVPHVYML